MYSYATFAFELLSAAPSPSPVELANPAICERIYTAGENSVAIGVWLAPARARKPPNVSHMEMWERSYRTGPYPRCSRSHSACQYKCKCHFAEREGWTDLSRSRRRGAVPTPGTPLPSQECDFLDYIITRCPRVSLHCLRPNNGMICQRVSRAFSRTCKNENRVCGGPGRWRRSRQLSRKPRHPRLRDRPGRRNFDRRRLTDPSRGYRRSDNFFPLLFSIIR